MIQNKIVIALWFVAAGLVTNWFRVRRNDALSTLEGDDAAGVPEAEKERIRGQLIVDGFVAGGILIGLYFLFDVFF